ncbi:hypothetical protein AKN87_07365 [Thiopseudomonas alkaliphila]|uniref:hypothetical protein n=1 Tax=Thiopseudomonas alkaliphila TaxID=1697053 RepID=UPI00069D2FB9|nr:hypothetical protein [Thiopseudomonas alkaliphila]AKX44929.1 hypothetical protein AKN87_07365 [Thiopseudomonas alkaliphila]
MDTLQLLEAAKIVAIIQSLFDSKPNEWLPVLAAIGGAFTGSIATFFPSYFLSRQKYQREQKAIATALTSEISALLKIIEHRKYLDGLIEAVKHLKEDPNIKYTLTVQVPEHYSRVYQSHVDRIGLIEPALAANIIEFHQLIDAVVQDIMPESPTQKKGGDIETFEELVTVMTSAISIGQKILNKKI